MEFIGKFTVNTKKGVEEVEVYSEMKKQNSLEYSVIPIYKIGKKDLPLSGQSSTFMKHKKAIDYIMANKDLDFGIDHSWYKGFKMLGILGRGGRMLKDKISDLDYFEAFFYYQAFKYSHKLREFQIIIPSQKSKKEIEEPKEDNKENTFEERAKLAQLILNNYLNKEDIESITDKVLSLSY